MSAGLGRLDVPWLAVFLTDKVAWRYLVRLRAGTEGKRASAYCYRE